jgi:hypothetical protein
VSLFQVLSCDDLGLETSTCHITSARRISELAVKNLRGGEKDMNKENEEETEEES